MQTPGLSPWRAGWIVICVAGLVPLAWPSIACAQPAAVKLDDDHPTSQRRITIDTTTGTWMSVDVAPDGQTLVFDMLGDVYRMPVTGGPAKRLTTARVRPSNTKREAALPKAARGSAFDSQPRYSPDGAHIAFISDRSGSDNLWIMDADGSDPRAISDETNTVMNSPAWSPNGQRVVCRKRVSYRTGELWSYPVHAEGNPPQPLTDDGSLIDAQGPVFSPDGRFLYFAAPFDASEDRPLRREQWQIGRLNRETGEISKLTDRSSGAVRPRLAPDGQQLTYASWTDHEPSLLLRNLQTGDERLLQTGVSRNLQDMYLSQMDLFPGYAFTPEGDAIYLSHGGHIRRLPLDDTDSRIVPMHVKTTLRIPKRPKVKSPLPAEGNARMLRWPQWQERDDRIVFEAMGRIWQHAVDGDPAEPRPLTARAMHAVQPALSPDGRRIAFVGSREDQRGGHVFAMPLAGGEPRQVTRQRRRYARPRWSPNGQRLAVVAESPARPAIGRREVSKKTLGWVPADGGAFKPIVQKRFTGAGARFSADGQRLQFTLDGTLHSVTLNGNDRATLLEVPRARQIVPSPSGTRVAISFENRVVVRAVENLQGQTLELAWKTKPYAKRAGRPGYFPAWTDTGALSWTFGGQVYRRTFDSAGDAQRVNIKLAYHPPRPGGQTRLALTGARLIPMTGDGPIDDGTIVIAGNRIEAVGPADQVNIPPDATVMNVAGKTIIPGLIDVHQHALAHLGPDAMQNLPRPFTPAAALLAYGITTTRDPALLKNLRDFSMIELINSGRVKGPRYFATGERIQPSDYRIGSLADAQAAIDMQKALGAVYIKEYLQPSRPQRQQLAQAARQSPIAITFEGGFDYKRLTTALLDGYTGTEHSAGNLPVYADFTQLVQKTNTFYVPTIMSQIGAARYYDKTPITQVQRLRAFFPERLLQQLAGRSLRGEGVANAETAFNPLVANVRRLMQAGATVGIGAHDMPAPTGLGTHWEIDAYTQGGVSNQQALIAATRHGAEILGLGDQLGTLKAGQLGDLVVLNHNPLQNIGHTRAIDSVMKNGLLYASPSLKRRWPETEKAITPSREKGIQP
jgi:Tol biopolymer transport system component/imidazolonepropionase-like amidohydrolase